MLEKKKGVKITPTKNHRTARGRLQYGTKVFLCTQDDAGSGEEQIAGGTMGPSKKLHQHRYSDVESTGL